MVVKRVNREKIDKHKLKMARRHLNKYKWKLGEIRAGIKTSLSHNDKWILKKAIKAERCLKQLK